MRAWYGPPTVSETRDLWMSAVLLVAGIGLLSAHLVAGTWPVGAAAFGGALAGALAALPLRIRHGQGRMVAFGLGVLLFLVPALPGAFPFPAGALPWWVVGLAFVAPLTAAGPRLRLGLLLGALACVLLALASRLSVLPPALTWVLLAAALHLGVQVLASRPRAPEVVPVGPRVVVFGGTFDPFHRGHRVLVEAALRVSDRVLVVVAGTPPHKAAHAERTAFHHRVAMTRLGVEGLPRVEVLEMEGRRPGPSYTIDTLRSLGRSYPPGTRFRLLLGADAFHDLPTWHEWEAILERAELLVAARPGHDLEAPPELEGRSLPVERLDAPALDVSSRALRAALAEDGDVGERLAPAVRTYIRDHRLYLPGGAGQGAVELAARP